MNFLDFITYFMFVGVLPTCMSEPCVYLVPVEVRRGNLDPLKSRFPRIADSSRHHMVLGLKPRPSRTTTSAPHH